MNKTLNSPNTQDKISNFINSKTDIKISYQNISLKITPKLKLDFRADYIFVDLSNLKKKKSSNANDFSLFRKFETIDIKKADIILNKDSKISANDIKFFSQKISLFADFHSKFLKYNIKANNSGNIEIKKRSILAHDFTLLFNNSPVVLNGEIISPKGANLDIEAKDLPVYEIESAFLYFQKSQKPDKNFLENFYDFKGLADIELTYQQNSLLGSATLKDFSAKTTKFSVPLYFKKAVFNFDKDKITSSELGEIGGNKIENEFLAQDIFSKNRKIQGEIKGTLTTSAIKYIPNCKMKGQIRANVKYSIKNQTPEVKYSAYLDKNTAFFYNNYSLQFFDKPRKLTARTIKKDNDLLLDSYRYDVIDNSKYVNLLSGKGLFQRKDAVSKFELKNISCTTKEYVPINLIGSLGDILEGGEFKGEIFYDTKLFGNFDLINSKFKDFKIKKASVKARNENIEISANGSYLGSIFRAYLDLDNDFKNIITIHDLNLYLQSYDIKRKTSSLKSKNIKIKKASKPFIIENALLALDRLSFQNIVLEKLELAGFCLNNIVYFSMPDINFANGFLSAFGQYDINKNASDTDFFARDIDSNKASGMIFALSNQFEGSANAQMHVITKDSLKNIDAKSEFSLENGKLTKLGSSEFIINKSKKPIKLSLSNLTNLDIKKMEALTSDIKGYFDVQNEKIKNIEIFNKNKFLSLYATGNYNIKNQDACVCLFGKYNKNAQKGIKILFVPLSWVTKIVFRNETSSAPYKKEISKIPSVEAQKKDEEIVSVSAQGNINDSKALKINLLRLK